MCFAARPQIAIIRGFSGACGGAGILCPPGIRRVAGTLASCLALAFARPVSAQVDTNDIRATPMFQPHYFADPERAQRFCPTDMVVWLRIRTHVYFLPGSHGYGRAGYGAFVCRTEARTEGDLPARTR